MTPQPTAERYVYRVPSDTNPKASYRVDLLANEGAGWCECRDFATRRQPNLDAGVESLTKDTLCKHLRATQRAFLRGLLRALASEENRPLRAANSR
jgi:hypothetical protein